MSIAPSTPRFTDKQGQYLAFIHAYTLVIGRSPAEADILRYFQVSPPTVHQMIRHLDAEGLIQRTPGKARSITLLINATQLPPLRPAKVESIKTTVPRY
jgi:DNA-binding MarR family transcriptional regulator